MTPIEWNYDQWKFLGFSIAGIRTALAMPQLSLSFDVAQGQKFLLPLNNYLITHGHLDHAAGIPYLISQKAMHGLKPPTFYMPPGLVEPMKKIMNLWSQIEDHTYQYEFKAVSLDQEIPLKPGYFAKVFKTVHRVESFGYTVFREDKKLKPELHGLTSYQLLELKKQGQEIENVTKSPIVSFTGDTQIEFLQGPDFIKKSQILFIETTFIDEKKDIASAKKWGHLHLDELIELLPSIESEKIVLIHLSARYTHKIIKELLSRKLKPEELDRVLVYSAC